MWLNYQFTASTSAITTHYIPVPLTLNKGKIKSGVLSACGTIGSGETVVLSVDHKAAGTFYAIGTFTMDAAAETYDMGAKLVLDATYGDYYSAPDFDTANVLTTQDMVKVEISQCDNAATIQMSIEWDEAAPRNP